MNYINIFFPFSSRNDNNYQLRLTLNGSSVTGALAALNADTEVFTAGLVNHVGNDTIYNYTGTLAGSVRVTDDEREDYFEPLVMSKLSFNMAVQTFPAWLMAFCANYTAKVVLVRTGTNVTVMWRGYLVGQTLNMTVVNNLLSVQLVAVDEVAMAKYMNFKQTIGNQHYGTLVELMEIYFTLHFVSGIHAGTPGFSWLYGRDGYPTSNLLLWQRDLSMVDDDGNTVTDLPDTLVVNFDRWILDEKATWQDVFDDVFRYLGVTFSVGGWDGTAGCDCWMLTTPGDNNTVVQHIYNLYNHVHEYDTADRFEMLENPTKVGANLQITTEPDRYKKAIVTSTPQRWEKHDYLTEEHYKEIDHNKYVRLEWGQLDNTSQLYYEDHYGWHKLRYIKPDTEEGDFVEIPACADGEGLVMARLGVLPYDNLSSCDGLTEPTAAVADSLDFITFKEGCCCIKMGESEMLGGVDEDRELIPYFIILNHMWGNMYNEKDHTMQTTHLADTPWLKLKPLAAVAAVHPSEAHYLSIKMNVMFIRENMPARHKILALKAVDAQTPPVQVTWETPAILMPSETTLFDFSASGSFNATLGLWYDLYFEAYIRIGDFYYDGTYWQHVAYGDTPPKCQVTMWNDTTKINRWNVNGQAMTETTNYYFTLSTPYRGANIVDRYNNTQLLTGIGGLSVHNQPLDGQLEMQILGQIRFQNSNNSVPFLLINNIEINYTDDAELMGKNIDNKHTQVMSTSPTKEELQRDVKMASPSVDGFFSNALVYDGGKSWHNLQQVKSQSGAPLLAAPEWWLSYRLAQQYSAGQLFVELETPVLYDDNVHNVNFHVLRLTEADGDFLPVKREFDYTKETMKVKLMRINTAGAV